MGRSFLCSSIAVAAITCLSADASANTILTYQGQAYTTVYDDVSIDGEYDTSMNVSGWLEIAQSLAPNTDYLFQLDFGFPTPDPGLLDYELTDGVWNYTNTPAAAGDMALESIYFAFSTDAHRELLTWNLWLNQTLAPGVRIGGGDLDISVSSSLGDWGHHMCDNCDPSPFQGFEAPAGQWTSVSVPDAVSSLTLMTFGITAIGLVRRRQERRARVAVR